MNALTILLLVVGVCSIWNIPGIQAAIKYEPNWASLDSRPLPAWYDKAKIGIFIHWGLYAVPGFHNEWFQHEWLTDRNTEFVDFMHKVYPSDIKYEQFAPMFKAEFFNASEWADMFKKSGAKYVVLTAKHHEGYSLWATKYSPNWNSMEVGPHRDLVGDLAKAVRGQNLIYGLYHSLLEWYHPLYQKDAANNWATHEFVKSKIRPSLEELVNVYKPELIFSDGDWEQDDTYWNSTDFLAWLYNESPVKDSVVVNDRWGKNAHCKHGGYFNCDDRFNPGTLQKFKFETAMTIDWGSWGYRRDSNIYSYMSIHDLLYQVARTVSCGGNILINVGPRPDGKIPPIFEERLLELGDWLNVNGEAIYESKPWIHQEDSVTKKDLWYTQRDGHVYGILISYRPTVEFGDVTFDSVKSVKLLGHDDETLPFAKASDGKHTSLHMPVLTPLSKAKNAYVFRFELK